MCSPVLPLVAARAPRLPSRVSPSARLALLIALAMPGPAFALQGHLEQPLGWRELEPLPLARDGAAAASLGGALYVTGGASKDGTTGRIDRYQGGKWETLPVTLLPRRHHALIAAGTRLYVLGGRGDGGPVAAIEVFDTATGTVRQGAPMPTPRYFAGAALFNGQIFVSGGTFGWGRLSTVEVYDPALDEWYVAPPLSEARDAPLVVAGGELFALGGYRGEGTDISTRVERWDGARWVRGPDMPLPTSSYAVAAASGLVFTFGDHRETSRVLRFDPRRRRWTALDTGFLPRRYGAAVAEGSRIYVFGGSTRRGGEKLRTVELFELSPSDTGTL